jgi:hypothetical protein
MASPGRSCTTTRKSSSRIHLTSCWQTLYRGANSSRFHEQHIFSPKFLNAARFGFNRAVAIEGGVSRIMNPLLADAAFGFAPGQFVGVLSS